VMLSGEAGFGKSRLIQALHEDIATTSHFRLSYQCSPHQSDSAFYPIIQTLSRTADIGESDAVNDRCAAAASVTEMTDCESCATSKISTLIFLLQRIRLFA